MTRLNAIAITAGIVVFFLLISLAQEVNRQWQVQRQIQTLEAQVHGEQASIAELQNLNEYFRTDDFQERLAREKLNYRAPGEKVVLIPDRELGQTDSDVTKKDVPEELPSFRQWWNAFFAPIQ